MEAWIIPVLSDSYKAIASGDKVKEILVSDPADQTKNYRDMNIGDMVSFIAVDEKLSPLAGFDEHKFLVNNIQHYTGNSGPDTVEKAITQEGFKNIWPHANSVVEVTEMYERVKGNLENIQTHGLYVITFGDNAQEVISRNE